MEQPEKENFDFSNIASPEDIRNLANDSKKSSELIVDSKGTTKDVSTGEMTDRFGDSVEQQPSSQNEVDESMLRREVQLNPPIQQVVNSFKEGQPTGSFATLKEEVKQKPAEVATEEPKNEKVQVSDFRRAVNELRNTYEPHSEVVNRESSSDEILDELHNQKATVIKSPSTEQSVKKSSQKDSVDPKVLNTMKKLGGMNSLDRLTKRISETNEAGDFGAIAPDEKIEKKAEEEDKETDMQIVLREIHTKLEHNIALERSERVVLQLIISNMVTIKSESNVNISTATNIVEEQDSEKKEATVVEAPKVNTNENKQILEAAENKESRETNKQKRDWKRLALIAGGFAAGSAVTILRDAMPFWAPAVFVGMRVFSGLGERFLTSRYLKNMEKLKTSTDAQEKERLEKALKRYGIAIKVLNNANQFLSGFAVGTFVTTLGMHAYRFFSPNPVGAEAVTAGITAQDAEGATAVPTETAEIATDTSTTIETVDTTATTIPAETVVNTPTVSPEVNTGGGVLLSNGRVNLPGSAWNGNIAGKAIGGLEGGELNYSNYAGGWHEMAPKMLEDDLISSGISRNTLFSNLDTAQIHRLINGYLADIQSGARGATNPDLVQNLSKLGTEGAQNLINMIQGR